MTIDRLSELLHGATEKFNNEIESLYSRYGHSPMGESDVHELSRQVLDAMCAMNDAVIAYLRSHP